MRRPAGDVTVPRLGPTTWAVALVALLVVSCGSTVASRDHAAIDAVAGMPTGADGEQAQHNGTERSGPPNTAGHTGMSVPGAAAGQAPPPAAVAAQPSSGSAPGTAPAAHSPDQPADPTQPTSGIPATAPTGLRPVAPGVRGVTDETIAIGFIYPDDTQGAGQAVHGADVDAGSPRANFDALIGWLNVTGGLAGRRLEPVYHTISQTSATPYSVQEQEACQSLAEDHEVYAIFTGGMRDTFLECIHRHPVALLAASPLTKADDEVYRQFPRWLEVSSLSLSAIAELTPVALDEQGFFQPDGSAEVRVGVMTFDDPRFRRALDAHLLPTLGRLGHEPVEVAWARPINGVSDMGDAAAAVSNAILRFRAARVTHVMLLDDNQFLTFLFMNQAENQGWRPVYGLNSQNGGQVQIDTGLAPREQFEKAMLVGWYEDFDVQRASPPSTWPQREQCLQIYSDAGIALTNAGAERTAFQMCDIFFFARAALDAGSGPLSPESIVEGAAALGASYVSPHIGPTRYADTRRYGVSRYNVARHQAECGCLRYIADWRPIP